MSKVLTSLGVCFLIGYTEKWGTLPTTFYKIPQIIENSEIDLDPDAIDTTSYDNLKYKSSVSGLIDTSGIMSLTANATVDEDAERVWDNAVDMYEQGHQIWLCTTIPHKHDAAYMPIIPIRTGAYNTVVNDRITIKLKYTLAGDLFFVGSPVADSYLLNENIDAGAIGFEESVYFFSGGKDFSKFYVNHGEGNIMYDDTIVYHVDSGWFDEKYRRISVTPARVSPELSEFLNQNATKIDTEIIS
jgi:hypothetical protein